MNNMNSDVLGIDEVSFLHKLNRNPLNLDEEMIEYLKNNPEKLAFVTEAKAFDEMLIDTLSVPAPEGLADRIIVKNEFSKKVVSLSSWSTNLFLVAASFLVVTIGLWSWQSNVVSPDSYPYQVASLEDEISSKIIEHVLDHTIDQTGLMHGSQLDISDAKLKKIFKFVGATMHTSIDEMSYAGACVVGGIKGLHIVIQEKTGPVTVIVMPGKELDIIHSFNMNGYIGNLIPVKGAIVAIIGRTEVQVAMVQIIFFKAVDFS